MRSVIGREGISMWGLVIPFRISSSSSSHNYPTSLGTMVMTILFMQKVIILINSYMHSNNSSSQQQSSDNVFLNPMIENEKLVYVFFGFGCPLCELSSNRMIQILIEYIRLLYLQSTMRNQPKSQQSRGQQNNRNNHFQNSGMGGDFLFNKTSLLSSALQKLKGNSKTSKVKRVNEEPVPLPNEQATKKVKVNSEHQVPTLSYTPLQKDLYNFYTINKISLKNFTAVPEPKLEQGSVVLAAICDRGIGGKYLVANLFRNKKAYIDFSDIPLEPKNDKAALESLEAYQEAGQFVVGTVIKPRTANKIQISFSGNEEVNEKILRIGQVLVGEVRSKEELGCHIKVKGILKHKIYLPKSNLSEESFEAMTEGKQIVSVIKEIDEKKQLIKITLISEEEIAFNLRGVEEEDMSKLDLENYVVPGTLVNTKVIKVLTNGIMVKFLKIFIGFIHADHLVKPLESYTNDEKIMARVIYQCNNPPTIFLSERHKTIKTYEPARPLYSAVAKPEELREIQHSYLSPDDEFFAHPLQLHSEIANVNKFWAKENNYFEGYQIMSSKKIGLKVGEVAKVIPFTNFKIYGSGQGKFRVMCLDVWNKVIKVSYDKKILIAKNLLFDTDDIEESQKYCGFISNVNANGTVVEFCNNIRGILSQRELQLNNVEINAKSIGTAIEVYVTNNKKNYLGLTLTPPDMRKAKTSKKGEIVENDAEGTSMGVIQSISPKSIHPIYIKLKNRLIKINIFDGIRPASLDDLPIIQDIESNYQVGQRIQVFQKKGQFYLYPPEQLSDKSLRFCRVIGIQNNSLRLQIKKDEFKSCHICDITDLISPFPLHQYSVGDYTIGRILDERHITLRKSLVLNGLPKSMQEVVKYYGADEKRGDYRARIEAVGPSALKLETVAFGYIKTYSDKGCFISLSRNFDVRVDKSELSDLFLNRKEQIFTPNKLVLLRLINSKTKGEDLNNVQFDASLRESVVKHGYPLNDEILAEGVGLTVKGLVTGYTKGKALVRLESSKFTGIIALKDVEGSEDGTLEKVLPIGKQIVCKIIEYSLEGEKRLIRLSTLRRFFTKYQGLETTFDSEAKTVELWDNFQSLSAVEAPAVEEKDVLAEDNNEEQEYERLKKLLAENQIEVEGEQAEEEAEEDVEGEVEEAEQEEVEEVEEEADEDEAIEDENAEDEEDNDSQEQEKIESKAAQKKQKKQQKAEMQKKVAQFQQMPHTKEFYQSLVLANPTPESYLLYISSLLPTSSPEEIRTQFVRAINSLTDIKDKDNMWISWINTEQILGDFTGTVKKAIEANVGQVVYFRIIEILTEQENWSVALEFGKKMLKKFNRDPKAYISFLRLTDCYTHAGHTLADSLSIKEIMRRAAQCLKTTEITQIEVHHAKSLFDMKEAEQGRNVFEQLVTRHPKRVDLWSVYVDQEVKQGSADKARNLLERALTVGLKKKGVISLLKKYLQVEKSFGSEESVQKIIQRAKGLATSYETLEEDDEEIEDIE